MKTTFILLIFCLILAPQAFALTGGGMTKLNAPNQSQTSTQQTQNSSSKPPTADQLQFLQTQYQCQSDTTSRGVLGCFDINCASFYQQTIFDFTIEPIPAGAPGRAAYCHSTVYVVSRLVEYMAHLARVLATFGLIWAGMKYYKAAFTGQDSAEGKAAIKTVLIGFTLSLFSAFIILSWMQILISLS